MAGQAPGKYCVSLFTIGVYWKAADMDGEWGMNHPKLGAKIAGSLAEPRAYCYLRQKKSSLMAQRASAQHFFRQSKTGERTKDISGKP
jgi:hypothetical protein